MTIDLAGWQLDKLAANPQKQAEDASDADSSDDDIPFACLIRIFNRADKVIAKMKKTEAEGHSPGDGEENVPPSAQIEGLDESDPERSDSDQEG